MPGGQLGHLRRGRRARRRLRLVGGAGLGLRHRRHRHAGHRHAAVLRRRAPPVAQAAVARRSPAAALFLTVDLTFFAANLTKVLHGGWFPLSIALVVFVVLTTWQRGREIVTRNRTEEEGPLRAFVDEVRAMEPPVYRAAEHRRSSSTPTSRPRRWRCGPTSSTTTPPRVRRDHVDRDLSASRTSRRRARDRRRPRLPRRRHHPRDGALGFMDKIDVPATLRRVRATSRARSTSSAPPTSSRASRSSDRRPGHGAVAQAALRRHRAQRRQPRRALRPARRPDGRPQRAHRGLTR